MTATTRCPAWCSVHDGHDHFGKPVEIEAPDACIQAGLELRDGREIVVVSGDGEWVTQLSVAAASELGAALVTLAAQAEEWPPVPSS